MIKRSEEKIKEIEENLQELEEIIPVNFEEYVNDFKTKAACERYFERIVEAITDLSYMIIAENNFKTPEDDKHSFEVLFNEKLISETLKKRLQEAKGMRNILAHEYGKVHDELVFESISSEIIKDAKEFINLLK